MTKQFKYKRILSLLVAASLLVLPIGAGKVNAETAATAGVSKTVSNYDYFQDVYPALAGKSHVFQTATYEDIVNLFESEGTYAVLVGGSWSENTQAGIGYINEVAKAAGVSTIYNFDTRLDGDSFNIADSNNQFASKYVDLLNKYLTNLNIYDKNDPEHNVSYLNSSGVQVTANKLVAPFLFIYDKNHKDAEGKSAPVVSYLKEVPALSGLSANPAELTAYKAAVEQVFKASASPYSVVDSSAYIKAAFNKNYGSENPGKPLIFTDPQETLVYEHVTYHQLKRILASEGSYALLFGGSWCPNTQAVIKYINEHAKKNNVSKIYLFDTKLDSGVTVAQPANNPDKNPHNTETLQIRTSNHPYAKLYVDLVSTYLTNIKTQNNTAEKPSVISYVDGLGNTVAGDRLQVPYFFIYNKDNKDLNGNSAPILGHIELMYGWENIQPTYKNPDPLKDVGYAAGARYTNYTNALEKVFSRLEAVPNGLYGVAPTSKDGKDGQITGAGSALEYYNVQDAVYKYLPAGGTTITGLTAGTYKVRYAASEGYQGPTTATGAAVIPYAAGEAVEVVVPSKVAFTDVSDASWYSDAIGFLAARNITSGTDEEKYSPNATVTRGQFIVLLLKAYGIAPEPEGADNFADAGNTYYTHYLAAAKRLGIASGDGGSQFKPDAEITRQELFTLLYRSLDTLGKLPAEKNGAALSAFSDAGQVSAYAKEALQALAEGGVITGDNGKLNPKATTTRAQAAQVIYNLLSK